MSESSDPVKIVEMFSDLLKGVQIMEGRLSPDDLAGKLAQVLPQAIDKLTPAGVVAKT